MYLVQKYIQKMAESVEESTVSDEIRPYRFEPDHYWGVRKAVMGVTATVTMNRPELYWAFGGIWLILCGAVA